MPLLGILLNTVWVEFPRPDKIDRFVPNDGDRKTEVLESIFIILLSKIRQGKKKAFKFFSVKVAYTFRLSLKLQECFCTCNLEKYGESCLFLFP